MVEFFVPDGDGNPVQDEALYADLGKLGRSTPEPPNRRIRSITWTSRGEEWTATVGETLRGVKSHAPAAQQGRTEDRTTP